MQLSRSKRISVAVFTLLTPVILAFQNCSPTSLSTSASTQGGSTNNGQSSGGEPATGNTDGTGSSGGATTPPVVVTPPSGTGALKMYGNPWATDSLANIDIGNGGYRASYRFRAKENAPLNSFRVYWTCNYEGQPERGYAHGTGGTIRIDLVPDDGSSQHAPNLNQVLASTQRTFNLIGGYDPRKGQSWFQQQTFPSPANLVAGKLYHLVFTNIDNQPDTNWIGINRVIAYKNNDVQQPVNAIDWGALYSYRGGSWAIPHPEWTDNPILQLNYGNGVSQGIGIMEVWIGKVKEISTTKSIRQVFTFSKNTTTVSSVSLRLKSLSFGSVLKARVEKSDGSLVAESEVPAPNSLMTGGLNYENHNWLKVPFAKTFSLVQGQSYRLVFTSSSGVFYAYMNRDGDASQYGFSKFVVDSDGYAQYNNNDGMGWLGAYAWDGCSSSQNCGRADYVDSDWQYFFLGN